MRDRVAKEVTERLNNKDVKVIQAERYAVWTGGSIASCLSTWRSLWVTREEWEEVGSSIL